MIKKIFTALVLIAAFCVLISLGLWQKHRLEWKESLLAQIAQYEAVDVSVTPLDINDSNPAEYKRGRVDGRFLTDQTPVFIGPRTLEGASGYHVLMPYRTSSGAILMINRGWVPAAMKDNIDDLPNPAWIGGYLRYPDRGSMTPDNRPITGLWYWPDIKAMEEHFDISDLYPAILYAETTAGPISEYPVPFDGLPKPRNKHAQYMMFWFGMAGLLVLLSSLLFFKRKV